jgi:heme/copper-type cytochrome/quinol oxidase subunit 2
LLAITFVGGLLSLVAAAGIIGGAIALARAQEKSGLGIWGMVTAVVVTLFVSALVLFKFSPARDRREKWLKWMTLTWFGFAVAFVLLVWIGVAAGVK